MVCAGSLRGLVLRAAARELGWRRLPVCGREVDVTLPARGCRGFLGVVARGGMTVDDASMAPAAQLQPRRCAACSLPHPEDVSHTIGGFESEDGRLRCGYSSFRGRRATMEDFYDIKLTKIDGHAVSLFGVFDGHGGACAAMYLKEHLFENLMKHPKFMTDTKLAISETYQRTDADFLELHSGAFRDAGSTALTAVLVGGRLYVANVGDSRAVISKAGKAIPLSEDHKPNRSDERKRIENAGGVVIWAGTWRVGGVLAMSRAFGNRLLKPFVIAEPEIQEEEVNKDLEYLVLATDGLWDGVENEDAISLAKSEDGPEAAVRKLMEVAFYRGSADNITCIVVQFHHDILDKADSG